MQLTESLILVRLSFGLPGQTRQIDGRETADAAGAQRDRVKASIRLYTGSAFQAIKTRQGEIARSLQKLAFSVDATIRGTYILPRAMLDEAEAIIATGKADVEQLVTDFLAGDYEAERDRARKELGSAFSEELYPPAEAARTSFKVIYSYFAMDVPEGLPPEIQEREIARLKAETDAIAQECREALRGGFADLIAHLTERLAPDADGRRKRLHETAVTNLADFLATLERRDITGDSGLRQLAAQARTVIGGVSAETLRQSAGAAESIRAQLGAVKTQLDAMIRTEGARKFDLEGDTDAA
jgi:hypothetical protein